MQLPDPVTFAIPAFVLLILIEATIGRFSPKKSNYEMRDSAASLMIGLGNFAIGMVSFGVVGAVSIWVYQYRLFDIGYHWWAFLLILFVEDFCYYWFHRLSHEHRIWWAAHINHHSSQYYNLTTALRQTWTGGIAGTWTPWLLLSFIGFPLPLIIFQKGISLVYQFWIHTEVIDRMWSSFESINEYSFSPSSASRDKSKIPGCQLRRNFHPLGQVVRKFRAKRQSRALPLWHHQANCQLQPFHHCIA